MSLWHKSDQEVEILKDIDRTEHEILDRLTPKLSFIKIKFTGGKMPEGPVTIQIGAVTVASIDGFDQNGAPFTGAIPQPPYAIDNTALASIAPDANSADEDVTGVAAGVANLTATVQGPNGPLTDTETVTVLAAAPVLSSIKINFNPPAVAAVKKA